MLPVHRHQILNPGYVADAYGQKQNTEYLDRHSYFIIAGAKKPRHNRINQPIMANIIGRLFFIDYFLCIIMLLRQYTYTYMYI